MFQSIFLKIEIPNAFGIQFVQTECESVRCCPPPPSAITDGEIESYKCNHEVLFASIIVISNSSPADGRGLARKGKKKTDLVAAL